MPRERQPLPFGLGIDRATGAMAVSPRSFVDLRGFYAQAGGLRLVPGLATTWFPAITTETDLVCIAGIRATKDIVLVTYDRTSRFVKVWRINPITAPTLQNVATWGSTTGTERQIPRIVAAESFGKLYLAHDEPTIGERLVTKVYTPNAVDANVGTLASLQANLDNVGVADVKFRGVLAYNDSLWGWGFGTASDQDRPEIIRVSDPGAPDVFQPQALFYAGGRKDPVTAIVPVGGTPGILAVRKRTEGYRIEGNSPATYGIFPAEQGPGCEQARLAVTVGNGAFCWSHDGPRRLRGDGSSEPMGLALDLAGGQVLVGWEDTTKRKRLLYGFAVYEHTERLLRFVFPNVNHFGIPADGDGETLEYVCADPDSSAPQWSQGKLTVSIGGAGAGPRVLCAANVVIDKADPPTVVASADQITLAFGLVSGGAPAPTLSWRNNNIRGDEVVRIWTRRAGSGTYTCIATTPVRLQAGVAQPTQSLKLPPEFIGADAYDFAVDYVRYGGTWSTTPSGTTLLNQQIALTLVFGGGSAMLTAVWRRTSPTTHEVCVRWQIPPTRVAKIVLQKAPAVGGPWTDVVEYTNNERTGVCPTTDAELGTTLFFRISARGSGAATYEISGAVTTVSCFIGP